MISSGAGALAVQNLFSKFHLPALKVLIHEDTSVDIKNTLQDAGCEVYEGNLHERKLESAELLSATENEPSGIDLTFGDQSEGILLTYYDWLAYEILNLNPEYCLIPVGSGKLFRNVLEVLKFALSNPDADRRFFGDEDTLRRCTFIGVSCMPDHPSTVMDKLYTAYNAGVEMDLSPYDGFIGPDSCIDVISDDHALEAVKVAVEAGIQCEPSGIAGLGWLLREKDNISRSKRVVVVNTGKLRIVKEIKD